MIRTKGEPGTGDVVQAVRHMRMMQAEIRRLQSMAEDELFDAAKELRVPYDLVQFVHDNGKLPVVNFAAGGVATPADAALMMQLGAEAYSLVRVSLVRRSGKACRSDCQGCHQLIRMLRCWQNCPPIWAKQWSALTSRRSPC